MSDKYNLLTPQIDGQYSCTVTHIQRKNTKFVSEVTQNLKCEQCIFMDIFPFDYVPRDRKKQVAQSRKANILGKLLFLSGNPNPIIDYDGIKGEIMSLGCRLVYAALKLLRIKPSWIYKKYVDNATKYNKSDEKGRYVTSYEYVGSLKDKMPTGLLLIVMFVASALGGMIWGMIPAVFKANWNTNETLFTLMLNYVAMQVVTYCIVFWENPKGSNTVGIINQATKGGWLPELFGQKYGWNVVIVLILTVGMFIYLKYCKQGYEIAVVGESENTARYAGIQVKKVIIRTMAISGAICGIAGFVIVSGASHTISTATAGGRGFTAIIVAWLSKFNTFIMVAVSFGIVFMNQGAVQIATQYGLNENASNVLLGIILFFLIGAEFFINYRVKRAKK